MSRHALVSGWIGCLLLCSLLWFNVSGCSDVDRLDRNEMRRSSKTGWSKLELPDVDRKSALAAGIHAVSQWFTIEEIAPDEGRIRSRFQEYSQEGRGERARDDGQRVFRSNMRRMATLMIEEQGGRTVALCRVDRERDDTAEQRLFYYQMQSQEEPTHTPIDMDASVPGDQRRSWTSLPRDRTLERQILDAMQQKLGPSSRK